MVAVATPSTAPEVNGVHGRGVWGVGTVGVLVVGLGVRLALGGGGTGEWSAALMAALLAVGAWLATTLLSTPRAACLVTCGVVVLFDLAALPPRFEPRYDSREAFYRTDQALTARVQVQPGIDQSRPFLTLLVEPVFPASASQPRFGLGGDVGGTTLEWSCTFKRGLQQLALPVPSTAVSGVAAADVRLHLTGSPSRETDYLLAYASAAQGGFLASLVGRADLDAGATLCSPG